MPHGHASATHSWVVHLTERADEDRPRPSVVSAWRWRTHGTHGGGCTHTHGGTHMQEVEVGHTHGGGRGGAGSFLEACSDGGGHRPPPHALPLRARPRRDGGVRRLLRGIVTFPWELAEEQPAALEKEEEEEVVAVVAEEPAAAPAAEAVVEVRRSVRPPHRPESAVVVVRRPLRQLLRPRCGGSCCIRHDEGDANDRKGITDTILPLYPALPAISKAGRGGGDALDRKERAYYIIEGIAVVLSRAAARRTRRRAKGANALRSYEGGKGIVAFEDEVEEEDVARVAFAVPPKSAHHRIIEREDAFAAARQYSWRTVFSSSAYSRL